VDLVGGVLFLLPVSGLIFYSSWDYVLASWSIRETSAENEGIPLIFLLKTLMLLMPATLFIQGVAEICRSALNLAGVLDEVAVSSQTEITGNSELTP
jgi:TRAP-type mannitol/chloroaromatic compound transport system permease small subunit